MTHIKRLNSKKMYCRGIGRDVAQGLLAMGGLKLRTWAVVAALVTLHAPVTFAVQNAGQKKHHAQVDRQLESLQTKGSTATAHVIVRFDRTALASMKTLMKGHGLSL